MTDDWINRRLPPDERHVEVRLLDGTTTLARPRFDDGRFVRFHILHAGPPSREEQSHILGWRPCALH